jgi:hypothetical protein
MESHSSEFTFDVHLQPGQSLSLPPEVAASIGPGHWLISIRSADECDLLLNVRSHSAFLNGYAVEDEGLYDDYPSR